MKTKSKMMTRKKMMMRDDEMMMDLRKSSIIKPKGKKKYKKSK